MPVSARVRTLKTMIGQSAARALFCGLCLFCNFLFWNGLDAAEPATRPFAEFSSVNDCALCHSTKQVDVLPFLNPDGKEKWILYEEFEIWQSRDKHLDAFAVLSNQRSVEMARLMGLPKPQLHRDKRCLACHSGLPMDEITRDNEPLISDAQLSHPHVQGGVTCESCHGRSRPEGVDAAGRVGWNFRHRQKDLWRFAAPHEKAEFGFYDVRTPSSQAKLCLSCHLGDASQGRVITHDMYAAGHPPLAGFELRSFSSQMPLHWRELEQKDPGVRKEFCEKTGTTCDPQHLFRTQTLLAGAVVSLRQVLQLTLDTSAGLTSLPDPLVRTWPRTWPELAQFECYACHHELQSPGWRQQSTKSVPGRPQLRGLPVVLVEVAIQALGDSAEQFHGLLAEVQKGMDARPFGETALLKPAAEKMIAYCDELATRLDVLSISREQGMTILNALCEAGQKRHLEFDAARQIAWGLEIVCLDLTVGPGRTEQLPEGHAAQELLKQWRAQLLLDLPARAPMKAGQPVPAAVTEKLVLPTEESPEGLSAETNRRTTYEVNLKKTLPPIGEYDLARFRLDLQSFAELVPKMVETPAEPSPAKTKSSPVSP